MIPRTHYQLKVVENEIRWTLLFLDRLSHAITPYALESLVFWSYSIEANKMTNWSPFLKTFHSPRFMISKNFRIVFQGSWKY